MRERLAFVLSHRAFAFGVAILSAVLLAPVLSTGFQLDDHFQRFRLLGHGESTEDPFAFFEGDALENRRLMELGSLPWWTAPELRHSNLRALSTLTMRIDYALWPGSAAAMHLHSLLWLMASVLAAALLYRAVLGPTWVAGLAALLYALEDAHALPAAYLANRNALVAVCFGSLALLAHARWRQNGGRVQGALGPLCFALALAGGEMALATAGYLLAYALFVDPAPRWSRLGALMPHGFVVLAWGLAYRLGGFGSEGSGFYLDPLSDPLQYLAGLGARAPVLLTGQWTPLPSDLALAGAGRPEAFEEFGLVVVLVLVFLLWPLARRDRISRFWLFGSLLSLLPIAVVGPQNRLLLFVSLGSMALLARLVEGLASASSTLPSARAWRFPAVAIVGLLLGAHLVLAPLLGLAFVEWQERVAQRMEDALASVPDDPAISEQTLVVVNPPEYTYVVTAIHPVKALAGLPAPRRIRGLSAGTSPVELLRQDARTLEVRLVGGLFTDPFTRYFRSPELAFAVGDRVELDGFTADVLELGPSGDPDRILYRFDRTLEDTSLRWVVWREGRYVAFEPPAPGEAILLPAPASIFDNAAGPRPTDAVPLEGE